MSDETSAPTCEKCGTVGVPSYLVLSPVVQYWRCPDCFRIWTTLKSAIEQHKQAYAERASTDSVLSRCPECHASNVISLSDVLASEQIDYYRCGSCDCWLMVPKGKRGPATRAIFGRPREGFENDKAG